MNDRYFDLLARAKKAQSPEALMDLLNAAGVSLTREGAAAYYERLHGSGELADDELDAVAGGGCAVNEVPRVTVVEPLITDDGVNHLGHSGYLAYRGKGGTQVRCDCGGILTVYSKRMLKDI